MSPIPFPCRATAITLAIALLSAGQASALTMGELRTRSFIGQPFRATVSYRIAQEESHPQPRCLSLQPISGDFLLPSPVQIRVNEQEFSIEILSNTAISEPIIGLVLQSSCEGQNFSRSYTAFLDPEPLITAPALAQPSEPVVAVSPLTQQSSDSTPLAASQPAATPLPAAEKPAPLNRWPRQITVEQDITPAELASRYYPAGSKRHKQLLRRLYSANPSLVTPNAPIPAGSKLRTRMPAPPKSVLAAPPVTSTKPAVKPKPASKGEDRLTLLAEDSTTSKTGPRAEKREDPVRTLEADVSTMKDLQLKMETEVKQLQHSISDLAKSTALAMSAASDATSAAQEALANKATTRPDKKEGIPLWLWLAGGLLGVGGLSYWLGRRGQIASGYTAHHATVGCKAVAEINPFDTRPGIAREPITDVSIIKQGADAIEVEETESDIDRAQFLLAEGEVEEAISLLYQAIEENEQDVERWLILFHIFRERTMKTEYAQLAERFHALPPEEEDWDLVCNLGRKIDPTNPVYVHAPHTEARPAAQSAVRNEFPLDLLSAAAAEKNLPPAAINLDLPRLDLSAPLFDEAEPSESAPRLPDGKQDTKDDDFSKPCRY